MARASTSPWRGVAVFLALTFGLAWGPACLLRGTWSSVSGGFATELLAASAFYALTMGWQPLLAAWVARRWGEPRTALEQGLQPARPAFIVLAVVAPLALAGASVGIAWGAHVLGLLGPGNGRLLAPATQSVPSPVQALLTVLALVGSLLLVWLQCLSEEVGWRGYFLSRLMERIGPWRGLLLHGLLWGLWYALPLVLATEGLTRAPLRSTTFVLTCVLLGPLLGWLRLASRSIIPAVVANGVLTLAAGLPLLMQGVEVGWRGAAYGPPGWLPMALAFAALALGRCRHAVAVPRAAGGSFMDLDVLPRRRNHPTLH